MDRDNRKSHLAPQLSPATQELLRSSDSPTFLTQTEQTPTSGEIPIMGNLVSPRDQSGSVSTRSPTRGPVAGRPGGSNVHPGLGSRVVTTNSIPRYGQQVSAQDRSPVPSGSQSAGRPMFSLPMRPAPPGAPLPPPPSRRQQPIDDLRREEPRRDELRRDEPRRDGRRQATITPTPNGPQ